MEQEESENRRELEIDEKQVKKAVRKILEQANLYEMTEKKIRDLASQKLGLDLSEQPYRSIVSKVIEDFLQKVSNKLDQVKQERNKNTKIEGLSTESK